MERHELSERLREFRQSELPRLKGLGGYFAGRHRILSQSKEPGKPDNRLVNNFCKAITDSTVGYFMGVPVTYGCDSEETLQELSRLFVLNDEPYVNSSLSRDLSVYGRAFELLWCDRDGEVRFAPVSPEGTFPILSEDVEERLLGICRTYTARDGTVHFCYADSEGVYYFIDRMGELTSVGEEEHYFGTVPAVVYRNNRDMTGDFEPVLSLVDAYNRLESDCVNDFELFADSYLAISGMGGTTAADLEKLRRDRVLLLDDGGDAKWLTKSVDGAYVEALKTRIAKDIYRFSGTADLSEVDSGGVLTSGVAMKYRLISFENRVSVTEQFFRRGLRRRLSVIGSIYGVTARPLDTDGVRIRFTRNIPGQTEAAAELAGQLDGIVSRRTIHEILPFVEDPEGEAARIRAEGGHTDEE